MTLRKLRVVLVAVALIVPGCGSGRAGSRATHSPERSTPDLTPTTDDSQTIKDADAIMEAASPKKVYVAAKHTCSAYSLDDLATLYPGTQRDPVSLAQAYAKSIPSHASEAVRRAAYSGCLVALE